MVQGKAPGKAGPKGRTIPYPHLVATLAEIPTNTIVSHTEMVVNSQNGI
jgi:hypothetical protein